MHKMYNVFLIKLKNNCNISSYNQNWLGQSNSSLIRNDDPMTKGNARSLTFRTMG